MHAGEGEFSPLFLHPVLARHRVHAQASFQHQALTDLHLGLKFLGQVAPTHNFELSGGSPSRRASNRTVISPIGVWLSWV